MDEPKSPTAHAAIADLIRKCALNTGVDPSLVTLEEFRKYLRDNHTRLTLGMVKIVMRRSGGFTAIRDAAFPKVVTDYDIAKHQVLDDARANRRAASEVARRSLILTGIEGYAESIFAGRIIVDRNISTARKSARIVTLVLSDTHYGTNIKLKETTFYEYGRVEEARRTAAVIRQLVGAGYDRKSTHLNILLIGDIIEGTLHDQRAAADYSEQMARAIHVLSQALGYVAQYFKGVDVHCVSGNHDRFTSRHKDRASTGKADSAATVIYVCLKHALSRVRHMKFYIAEAPYLTVPVFEHKIFATHGDTVLNPGYPGKRIDIEKLETRIASLNEARGHDVFVTGHVHRGNVNWLRNGAVLITNSSLVPVDPYSLSLGVTTSQPGQMVFESIPGEALQSVRLLRVKAHDDKDDGLDKIVIPWSNINGE